MHQQDVQDIKRRIIEKATSDPTFRTEVLQSPQAAIRRELGIELSNELDIHVVAESGTSIWIVLPAPSHAAGDELAEADLAQVAGGKGIIQRFNV